VTGSNSRFDLRRRRGRSSEEAAETVAALDGCLIRIRIKKPHTRASTRLHDLPKGGAMFARLREMLDRWLKRRKRSNA
jgi:hypothetical protein